MLRFRLAWFAALPFCRFRLVAAGLLFPPPRFLLRPLLLLDPRCFLRPRLLFFDPRPRRGSLSFVPLCLAAPRRKSLSISFDIEVDSAPLAGAAIASIRSRFDDTCCKCRFENSLAWLSATLPSFVVDRSDLSPHSDLADAILETPSMSSTTYGKIPLLLRRLAVRPLGDVLDGRGRRIPSVLAPPSCSGRSGSIAIIGRISVPVHSQSMLLLIGLHSLRWSATPAILLPF